MGVFGTGMQVLTLRAITFKEGEFTWGGGIYVGKSAKVDLALCSFVYNRATSTSSGHGGGAIYVHLGTVNIIGTWFAGNTAVSNNGDDVMKKDGTVVLQSDCPSPFSANVPRKGEIRVRMAIASSSQLTHCTIARAHPYILSGSALDTSGGVLGSSLYSYKCNFYTCASGFSNPTAGLLISDCKQCSPGKYSSKGSVSCTNCQPGSYSGVGRGNCTLCQIGKYAESNGTITCDDCSTGKFLPQEGSQSQYNCQNCAAGTYGPTTGASACQNCTIGEFSPEMSSGCTPCSAGWYSSSDASSTCMMCQIGKYADARGSSSCKTCDQGTYTNDEGEGGKESSMSCVEILHLPPPSSQALLAAKSAPVDRSSKSTANLGLELALTAKTEVRMGES